MISPASGCCAAIERDISIPSMMIARSRSSGSVKKPESITGGASGSLLESRIVPVETGLIVTNGRPKTQSSFS